MKVRVIAKLAWDGFALRRRREGEVFDFPDKHIRRNVKMADGSTVPFLLPRWVEAVDKKPAPAKTEAPAAPAGGGSEQSGDVI